MSELIERTGDIFTTDADCIGHGVNTRGVMGAGIARAFRSKFPVMYETYRAACLAGQLLPGGVLPWTDAASGLMVFNIASQQVPGADARLPWLASAVAASLHMVAESGRTTLALPQIGCGIGGLAWGEVKPVLRRLAEDGPVDIEAWTFA